MGSHKAKQIGRAGIAAVLAGFWFAQVCPAENDGKSFLPIPGEVTTAPAIRTLPAPPPAVKTNSVPPAPAPAPTPEIHSRPTPAPTTSSAGNDWGTYSRERMTKVLLDGKLVEKSTLTTLVGFLVAEQAKLSNGHQTFSGAALDLAVRKAEDKKVSSAMELRPALWRNTNERVFLLNFRSTTSMPGALIRVYVSEVDPLEGWRTFKAGTEPSFEDWKRYR